MNKTFEQNLRSVFDEFKHVRHSSTLDPSLHKLNRLWKLVEISRMFVEVGVSYCFIVVLFNEVSKVGECHM